MAIVCQSAPLQREPSNLRAQVLSLRWLVILSGLPVNGEPIQTTRVKCQLEGVMLASSFVSPYPFAIACWGENQTNTRSFAQAGVNYQG